MNLKRGIALLLAALLLSAAAPAEEAMMKETEVSSTNPSGIMPTMPLTVRTMAVAESLPAAER